MECSDFRMGLISSRASAGTSGHADVTARWLTRGNFPLHQTIAFLAHRGHVVMTHPIRAISFDGAGRDAESQDGDSVIGVIACRIRVRSPLWLKSVMSSRHIIPYGPLAPTELSGMSSRIVAISGAIRAPFVTRSLCQFVTESPLWRKSVMSS